MNRETKIIKVSIFGIIVNFILVAFKATVGLLINSIAIILDAVNNLTDALSSLITIVGTKLSSKEPDKEHPYGHGRIEYFTSVIIGSIILYAGLTALKESISRIIIPVNATYDGISLIIIIVAIVIKFYFGKYVKNKGKKLNSSSLIASGQDAFMDAILSFSTFIAAIINIVFKLQIDGYIGLLISLVIIKSSIEILKDPLNIMIGARADKKLTDEIKRCISSYKEVQGVYDLYIHNYGPSKIIASAHIQVPDDTNAREIHRLTRKITIDIYQKFNIIITIGIYAANDSKKYKNIKDSIIKEIKKYKEIHEIHGLYIDDETKSIFFDLIFDFDTKNIDEIRDMIVNSIKHKYEDYNLYIILDADISD